jgi:cation transport ATPase
MNNRHSQQLPCPLCQETLSTHIDGNFLECESCESRFNAAAHLCPECQTYHVQAVAECSICGTKLSVVCQICEAANWSANDFCIECGEPLDLVDLIARHRGVTTTSRLVRQAEAALQIKKVEEVASKRRMTELKAAEKKRQENVEESLRRKRQQERKLTLLVFGTLVIFLLLLAVYAAINLLG